MTMPGKEPDPMTSAYDSGRKEAGKRDLARMNKARARIGERPGDYDPLEDPAFDKIGGFDNAMKVIAGKIAETAEGIEAKPTADGDHETLKTECTFKKGTMPDWVVEAFRISYVYCLKQQGKAVEGQIKASALNEEKPATYKDLTTIRCRDCQQIAQYCYEHGEEFPKCHKSPDANEARKVDDEPATYFDDDGEHHGDPEDD